MARYEVLFTITITIGLQYYEILGHTLSLILLLHVYVAEWVMSPPLSLDISRDRFAEVYIDGMSAAVSKCVEWVTATEHGRVEYFAVTLSLVYYCRKLFSSNSS